MKLVIVADGRVLLDADCAPADGRDVGRIDADRAVEAVARVWALMSDDAQARFFEIAGGVMTTWGAYARDVQQYKIGRHLSVGDCACITDVGRELVTNIFEGMQSATVRA